MEKKRKFIPIKITSLEGYLKKIKKYCFSRNTFFSETLDGIWFRGESRKHEHIVSSLFRGDFVDMKNGMNQGFEETFLMSKALQYYPALFEKCNNEIEKLVTMQHYTLPTRLLDVTKSPLVALYFACAGNKNESGRVTFLKNYAPIAESVVDELTVIIKNLGPTYSDIDPIIKYLNKVGLCENWTELRFFKRATQCFLYLPKYNNDRIKHQQGAVLFSPLLQPIERDCEKFNKVWEKIKTQTNSIQEKEISDLSLQKDYVLLDDVFEKYYFEIPSEHKQSILKDLDNCGINEAFVFPEPEHQMQYVKWYCSSQIQVIN